MADTAETSRGAVPALDRTALLLYAAVVFIWGTSWIALHLQLGTVSPEVSVVWRFGLASLVMLAYAVLRGERLAFGVADHLRFALLGALLFSSNFLLFYYGGLTVPSGLLAVVFSLASVFNLILGAVIFRQRVEPRVAAGGALGVLGVAAMFAPELQAHGLDAAALAGLAYCVLGTLCFCLGNMAATRVYGAGVSIASATVWGMIYGTGFLVAIALIRGQSFAIQLTPVYLASLLYLSIVASVLAFAAYLRLLHSIGAARAGYTTVLFPVVALAISTVAEGYVWTASALAGLVLVLLGNVLVLSRGSRKDEASR
jgi:drug/metabolite transporter (DMT)-like permease